VSHLATPSADFKFACQAINALGIDLYRAQADGEDNVLISPYSIQVALAMTYAGAGGDTRTEMQRVLHLPGDDEAIHESFAALALELIALKARSLQRVQSAKEEGGPNTAIELSVANRLFVQSGYPVRPAFLARVEESYRAPVEEMEFADSPDVERVAINRWVESQTRDRIRDLIPFGAITPDMRLVLVNALYLRAPWAQEFRERATKPERFLVHGREVAEIPTMTDLSSLGYAKQDGYQVVTRPYHGGELQFVIVLPDEPTGLALVERALTPDTLQEYTRLASRNVILHLPKFRIEPPTVPLGESLKNLGMKTAFDTPKGSANFDRMAPRTPYEYLAIGAVLHKTFLALDEKGTEAAAATAVMMLSRAMAPRADLEIRVDRPFLFAIQHVPSGACLFLGRVTDPR
jgi:serpin B